MNENIIFVGIGIVGWGVTILMVKLFRGSTDNKSICRCSNIVKEEIKSIRRYSKNINDSCK